MSILRFLGPWETTLAALPEGFIATAHCPHPIPSKVVDILNDEQIAFAESLNATRRREWVSGRYCLAAAAKAVGGKPSKATEDERGGPCVTGMSASISHKEAFTVALVSTTMLSGIDIEFCGHHSERFEQRVMTPLELQQIGNLSSEERSRAVTAYFSIKESVYKAATLEEQKELDFQSIEVQGSTLLPERAGLCRIGPVILRSGEECITYVQFGDPWLVSAAFKSFQSGHQLS